MAVRSSHPTLVVRVLVAGVLGFSALAAALPAGARTSPTIDGRCAETALTKPVRLGEALGAGMGVSRATVREQNDVSRDQLDRLAEDRTSWVDECGQVFVVDRAAPQGQLDATNTPAEQMPADVFSLSSRPDAPRTVYLDFDGATYSGTSWNGGAEVVSPAYSVDADRSTFSDTERAQILLAWQVVAEDFAPFDINVTTSPPSASALTRTSSSDATYGMPVVITPTNSVGANCGCGGQAYVGVFDMVGTTDYQPTWIYTNGSGVGGYNMGQVISHEIGHTLGLSHDGTSRSGYYSGAGGWAPIMGSSYDRRASQWSSGEYPDANNPQDDVAIIARTAPTLTDDHTDGAPGATWISSGTTTWGAITTRADTDAFSFVAGGATTLAVAGPSGFSDLDVRVTVLDAAGSPIATVNPTADTASDSSMGATWSVDLPSTGATFTAVVDGSGFGNPAEAGRYSDYGSLGRYAVSLTTQPGTPTTTKTGLTPPPDETPTETSTETPSSTPTPTETPAPTPTETPSTATPTATPTETPPGTTTGTAGTTASTPEAAAIAFVTMRLPRARVGVRYRATIRFAGPVQEALVDRRLPTGLTWRVTGDAIVIRGTVRRPVVRRFGTELTADGVSVRHRFRIVVR